MVEISKASNVLVEFRSPNMFELGFEAQLLQTFLKGLIFPCPSFGTPPDHAASWTKLLGLGFRDV